MGIAEGRRMARTTKTTAPVRPTARVGDTDLVERRRAQIVEAATRLVSRQGFAKTVVRDIAQEADISVGLVYEYVRAKEDILFLIYEHWSKVWQEGLEKALAKGKDPLEQLKSVINFLVSVADKHADVTHLFYREPGHLTDHGRELAKTVEREMVERVAAVVDAAVSAGMLRQETDSVVVATSVILLAHGWVLKGHLLHRGRSTGAYAASLADMVVQGWGTPVGRKAWERRAS
jgi:AcrR family transcriptional regulator